MSQSQSKERIYRLIHNSFVLFVLIIYKLKLINKEFDMKKIICLLVMLVSAVMFVGCGGGSSSDDMVSRSLKPGDYFVFDKYEYDVTNRTKTFEFNSGTYTGRYIDVYYKRSYEDTIIWFERDVTTGKNNGARFMLESIDDDYVVCVIPANDMDKGDTWLYYEDSNPKHDKEVYIVGKAYWVDEDDDKHYYYKVAGSDSKIYYEYCPDLGFFTYLHGEELEAYKVKSINDSKAPEINKSLKVGKE